MAKKLKVCLAMGGGVSLGSFSGAALTESLKLLVLNGRDRDGNLYESVEVDGMSGASAGSIALAIMMRSLIDYKSMLPILLDTELAKSETFTENQIEDRIVDTYNIKKDDPKFEIIKSLEVAQIIQKLIWVNALDTEKLFGSQKSKFGDPFGLLSRDGAVNDAKKILLNTVTKIDISNRKLLSDQALMAFTMANLSPIAYGEKSASDLTEHSLVNIFQTSTDIKNHNETRVFNFHFRIDVPYDKRYITIPTPEAQTITKKRSFNDEHTWLEIIASAVASGAFPIGFPPVILTKYKHEYAESEWKDTASESTNFAYVDGGAFNNEPIKEAFKLGSYIDFLKFNPILREKEDRLILFVDPSVPGDPPVSQLKSLDPLKEIKDNTFSAKQESTKMINSIVDLVSTVASQSEINEEAKINEFYQNSLLNKSLFDYFSNLEKIDLRTVLNTSFLSTTFESLELSLTTRQISLGTRIPKEFLYSKYKLICSKRNKTDPCLYKLTFYAIYEEIIGFVNNPRDSNEVINEIKKIITVSGCEFELEETNVGSSIFLAISELGLNQFGKDSTTERVGIFPIQKVNKVYKIENLPGHELSRFSGFACLDAREACFAKGRLDAIRCLSENDFREYHYIKKMKDKKYHFKNKPEAGKSVLFSYLSSPFINLELRLENNYKEFYEKWEHSFKKDVEENLRVKIVSKIQKILHAFAYQGSIMKNIGISFGLFLGAIYKKIPINVLVNQNVLSKDLFNKITHQSKNIAIKFRFKRKTSNLIFKLYNNQSQNVKAYYEDKTNITYFKCYLVMIPKFMKTENKVTKYCYLSINEYIDHSMLRNYKSIKEVNDFNLITQLKSHNNDFDLSSVKILQFIEDNYNKLKYNINPIIQIDKEGLSIHDLSVPLANDISTDWQPFL